VTAGQLYKKKIMDLTYIFGVFTIVFVVLILGTKTKSSLLPPVVTDFQVNIEQYSLVATWTANASTIPYITTHTSGVFMRAPITNIGSAFRSVLEFNNVGDTPITMTANLIVTDNGNCTEVPSNLFTSCVLGNVEIITKNGIKKASLIIDGEYLCQPNGQMLKIKQVLITNVTKPSLHSQLYAYKDTTITYWHKVLENGQMVYPKDSTRFIPVSSTYPFTVYNFLLEDMEGFIMTPDVVLETLKPWTDENGVEHLPWLH